MAHDVFISHSTKDKAISDAVCAALESAGIRCWIAPRDVRPGRSFAGEITRGIQQSKAMVLIFSAHSNNSEQVLREVQLAVTAHLHIVQFRIEDVVLNDDLQYFLGTPHWLDALSPPLENHIERLESSIKALLDAPAEQSSESVVAPVRRPQQPSHALAEKPVKHSKKKAFVVATAVTGCLVAAAAWYFGIRMSSEKASIKPPLQMASQAPKETASTTAPSATAKETEKFGATLLRIGTAYRIKDEGSSKRLSVERHGFIDKTGRVVIEPQWDEAGSFDEGLAYVKRIDKWGFIDKTGRIVIEPQWDVAGPFRDGLATIKRNDKWGFIDKTGRVVIEPKWDFAGIVFVEGLVYVKQNDKWGLIDKTGRVVIELEWDGASYLHEGLACVKRNDKYGFIDKTGRVVIEPQWDEAGSFDEGLAYVKRNNKYGFIDKTGRIVIEPQWDSTFWHRFSEGLSNVVRNDKWGFIDKTGRVVIEPQWDHAGPFDEGLALVERNDKWGFIDKTGRVVIEPQWDDADSFYEGLALVERDKKYGLVDKTGRVVVELQWDVKPSVYSESKDTPHYWLVARQDGSRVFVAWLDSTGKQIWSSDIAQESK